MRDVCYGFGVAATVVALTCIEDALYLEEASMPISVLYATMNNFKVKIVSQSNSIIVILLFLAILFAAMALRTEYLPVPLGKGYAILLSLPFMFLFYSLFQKIATAKTEWIFTDELITINWVTQFAFAKNEPIVIKQANITSYRDSSDPMYDTFKIKTFSDKEYKFYHSNLILSGGIFDDDYSKMVDQFDKLYRKKRCR